MNRRKFIQLGTLVSSAGIIAPKTLLADTVTPSMAGGVYYTQDAAGRWSKKVAGHLPQIELIEKGSATTSTKIRVSTAHGMKGYEHYIVKHTVLNNHYQFLAEKMFDPTKDLAPISEFNLGTYQGLTHVLSVCNQHDTWLTSFEI